ncbi:GIY-YIG nuclease family protein [Psychrobacter sp. AOP31-E1-50]|uniref:GIY-YIG nuclease family protein n=1 Tax=Psychrobacter sp. AOP31-E1-50 TaxID=3457692 RepID=UPI00403734F2
MELILSDLFNSNEASGSRASELITKLIAEVMSNYEKSRTLMALYDGDTVKYKESMDEACSLIDEAVTALYVAQLSINTPPHLKQMIESLISILRMYEAGVLIQAFANKLISSQKNISYTYLLRNPANNLVKIGKTIDIKTRLQAIQCGAGNKLEVLAVIDRNIEREMHVKFSDLREFNEWFRDPDGEIKSYFSELSKSDATNTGV